MPKRTSPLDRINIASPCSADWDEMVGNQQVRFCQHCSMYIHDLSKITRKDAIRLVAASKGKLCVRYLRRPDGTVETASRAAPVSQVKRRLSRIAAGAFTASLSLASNAAAVSAARPAESNQLVRIQSAVRKLTRLANPSEQTASLVGTVFDSQRAVILGAQVVLTDEKTGQAQSTVSNDDGEYQFQSLEAGTYKLRVEATGFVASETTNIVLQSGDQQRVDATLEVGEILGGAIVISPETPLVNAIWGEDMVEVRNLLAAGADVNAVDGNVNTTALAEAVAAGNLELVNTLLYAGADPNRRNSNGRTALMNLDDDATPEIVHALISAGAKVNLRDEDGDSAILGAAAIEKPEILQALLDAGAKVNARNKEGKTALMVAAKEGNIESVKALLFAGADVSRKNNDDETALKLARDGEHEDVVALLLTYGAYE